MLASIPVAALLGVLTIGQLYAVALIVGVCTVFYQVAYQSYVPAIVDRPYLVEANSRLEANNTVAATAGPLLAGVLVQRLTAPVAIVVDAASFLWSAAWVGAIDSAEPAPAPPAPGVRLRRQVAEGLRFVFRHPVLRPIALFNGTAMTFYAAAAALEVLFLLREVRVSATVIGLLFAGGSAGGILGALCAARLTRAIGPHRALRWYAILGGLGALLLPLTTDGWRLSSTPSASRCRDSVSSPTTWCRSACGRRSARPTC
jgi:hypothetical protein